MQFSNVRVPQNQTQGYFRPTASLDLLPFTTTLPGPGSPQTRTLQLPPWPQITGGAPSNWTDDNDERDPWLLTGPGAVGPTNVLPLPPYPALTKTPYTGPGDATVTPTGTWPEYFELRPVETEVPEEGEDDDGKGGKSKTSCRLWFFWVSFQEGERVVGVHGFEADEAG